MALEVHVEAGPEDDGARPAVLQFRRLAARASGARDLVVLEPEARAARARGLVAQLLARLVTRVRLLASETWRDVT